MPTLAEMNSKTLSLEIAVAVATDAFDARRKELESQFMQERGWKAPLRTAQFNAMNRQVDFWMWQSRESQAMSDARHALKMHNYQFGAMRHQLA